MALLTAPTAPAAPAPQGPGRSGLGLAAAASLALHAAGLAAVLLLPEAAALPEELVIEVVLEAAPQSLAAAPPEPEPEATPEATPEQEATPAPNTSGQAPAAAPTTVGRRPPRPAENPRPRPAAPARAEAMAASPAPAPAALPAASAPVAVAEAGERAEARRQDDYLRALLRWLEPHRRYPRAARLRGVEGTVRLRLAIDRTGRLLEAALEESSGARLLDQAALAMAAEAGPAPPFPEDWPAQRAAFVLPVRFALGD